MGAPRAALPGTGDAERASFTATTSSSRNSRGSGGRTRNLRTAGVASLAQLALAAAGSAAASADERGTRDVSAEGAHHTLTRESPMPLSSVSRRSVGRRTLRRRRRRSKSAPLPRLAAEPHSRSERRANCETRGHGCRRSRRPACPGRARQRCDAQRPVLPRAEQLLSRPADEAGRGSSGVELPSDGGSDAGGAGQAARQRAARVLGSMPEPGARPVPRRLPALQGARHAAPRRRLAELCGAARMLERSRHRGVRYTHDESCVRHDGRRRRRTCAQTPLSETYDVLIPPHLRFTPRRSARSPPAGGALASRVGAASLVAR